MILVCTRLRAVFKAAGRRCSWSICIFFYIFLDHYHLSHFPRGHWSAEFSESMLFNSSRIIFSFLIFCEGHSYLFNGFPPRLTFAVVTSHETTSSISLLVNLIPQWHLIFSFSLDWFRCNTLWNELYPAASPCCSHL